MEERINSLRSHLSPAMLAAFNAAVDDPRFRHAPGSSDKHHNWTGGLLTHTIEVAEIGLKMSEVIALNREVLLVSAAWHDFGKIWAYTQSPVLPYLPNPNPKWRDSELKSKSGGHLARSYGEFMCYARRVEGTRVGLLEYTVEEIMHCILSHHGCREWGSPARPQSREAWVLHLADGASARCLGGESFEKAKK